MKRIGKDVELRVAGVTEDDYIVSLVKKKYPKDQFEADIRLLGQIPAASLAGELANADAFVHPSHIDNSPNSVCEAMLVGTPVVSTNVGGIPSLLVDKHEGLLVQDGDPCAMAGAVIELLDSPNLALRLSQNARLRAQERHDPDAVLKTLQDVYSQIRRSP
jgi:glycosyltransferase involved in cell wall biosynthesis